MKKFKIVNKDKMFIVKANSASSAVSKLKDAKHYFTKEQIYSIEKEAKECGVEIVDDVDERGYYLENIYYSTTGTWLNTTQEIDEYIRKLQKARKFIEKYQKYV